MLSACESDVIPRARWNREVRFDTNVRVKTRLLVLTLLLLTGRAVADTKVSGSISIGGAAPAAAPAVEPGRGKGPPPWAPAHGRRAKYRYQYYPAQQVYHRPSDGVWFFLSGGQWRSGASLPAGMRIDVGSGFVPLDMDVDKPFAFHADVAASFSSGGGKPQPTPTPSAGEAGGKGKGHGKPKVK